MPTDPDKTVLTQNFVKTWHSLRSVATMRIVDALLIDLAHVEGNDVLRLVGELDLSDAERASRVAAGAIAAGSGPFVVDLSELTYCDSSGIKVLLEIKRRACAAGRTVILRHPHARVRRVLDLAAVTDHFVIDPLEVSPRRVF